ncbi:alpha/beta hydrolase [Rickettsiales endosymbiont of Stachyamoeba lipophora]|uniref:alpha/beta hydrolase n=1 Tax=Rickettsiales endosymbiont of Stachyamoeba lipophora TaxID=2486578 RepID=UPI000F65555C|nr:alpha/beta hydrolase [Rickettsiales endosymbiont of Stachyamoeba lipophora]AZL15678.1 alpha/beta hydrolase [Rickettsiales endosymbiont of Stachyamoeba lipophora]
MNDTKFINICANHTLAYLKNIVKSNDTPEIVFIHGFRSDKRGTKTTELWNYCVNNNLDFLSFDLSNHGESSGDKFDGSLDSWLKDVILVLEKLTSRDIILIGSSMGGWLAMLAALHMPKRIKGFIGIAAAPDFTEDFFWEKLNTVERDTLLAQGEININYPESNTYYFVRKELVVDSRKHLLLNKSQIEINCPVRLLQGMEDLSVPYVKAINIAHKITSTNVRVELIKDGDHRLSRPEDISILLSNLEELLSAK